MKRKLTIWNSLIILLSITFMLVFGILLAKNVLLREGETNTIALTHAYKEAFTGDTSSLVINDKNIRETIILENGDVLWDSEEEASKLESHKNREEVIAALEGKPKTVIRSSESVGISYIYYAETKEISSQIYVIRIATRMSSLTSFLSGYIPWVSVGAIFLIGLSVTAISFVTNRSLRPLKELEKNLKKVKQGEPLKQIDLSERDELGAIISDIDDISKDLSHTMIRLRKEEEKTSLLLNNLPNPIIAIGKDDSIVFANPAAKSLFSLVGNILPDNLIFGDGEIFKKDNENKIYLISKKEAEDYSLFVFNDITIQMNLEKQRKEFVDAASHELKTPLTAINGFNELIKLNSENPKIQEYTAKIASSSERMLSVIQDMLAISLLEEKQIDDNLKEINLSSIAEEEIKRLSLLANNKGVRVFLEGEMRLKIEEKDASLIFKNLVENAILYNVPNGIVSIVLKNNSIEISDTGIGISPKDQERVFERFYRVDKSRSRQNGGTGLGLSIVKHAILKYGGKINLTSRLGYGTKITISFA